MTDRPWAFAGPLLAAAALAVMCGTGAARAAAGYDNCTGFIDSLPAVIESKGTWCLRRDLSTSLSSGYAIDIRASQVRLDCAGFKVGGHGAGKATSATGIYARNLTGITVRRCNVRGFSTGIDLDGFGADLVVEDNRLDGNTYTGVRVSGDGSVVRRNRVGDTGGMPDGASAYGIETWFSVDVLDNTVSGVSPLGGPDGGTAYGILTNMNEGGRIAGNRVRGLAAVGEGSSYGIFNERSVRASIRDNDLAGPGVWGLLCVNGTGSRSKDNTIVGFEHGLGCNADSGTVVAP